MLFVGDDWAEDHHDVELMNESGSTLVRARLPEGIEGIEKLHAMIGSHVTGDDQPVLVGIETDRGPWVLALTAAGYQVFGVNPLQASRFRERRSVSGAKSDATDAHSLADMVRTDHHQLRPVAGDTDRVQAVKVITRAHKTLIWERTRHTLRLRQSLRDYFPAALDAFDDLDAVDALELLGKAPDPASAAKLTIGQIRAALKHAHRHNIDDKAEAIAVALRGERLRQLDQVTVAYAATTRASIGVLRAIVEQVGALRTEVEAHFGEHPDADIITSLPGLGVVLGARVLAEFGDDRDRYRDARARKNYAGTSPITRASGKKKIVAARFVRNDRLADALMAQAFACLTCSPGARDYYDKCRQRGNAHNDALRRVANRFVGILHGCLKTRTRYDEAIAWQHGVVVPVD